MARILVSGFRGFIGHHLYRTLADQKHELIGIDLKDGRDILDLTPDDFEGVDYVFHLAAQAKVQLSIDRPVFTNRHNVEGTLNVLRCAAKARVKKVIFSSSSSIYGDQKEDTLHEEMKPNPMSPYGLQKLIGEQYCKMFSRVYKLKTVCLRYFNVYGEQMPTDGAYPACIASFLKQRDAKIGLTIMGGEQTRDFTYVGDVVNANLYAMESKLGNAQVINIGAGESYSINEIANAITQNVKHLPQREGEPMHTRANNSRALDLLNWYPTVNVIEWLKSQ